MSLITTVLRVFRKGLGYHQPKASGPCTICRSKEGAGTLVTHYHEGAGVIATARACDDCGTARHDPEPPFHGAHAGKRPATYWHGRHRVDEDMESASDHPTHSAYEAPEPVTKSKTVLQRQHQGARTYAYRHSDDGVETDAPGLARAHPVALGGGTEVWRTGDGTHHVVAISKGARHLTPGAMTPQATFSGPGARGLALDQRHRLIEGKLGRSTQ